MKVVYLAYAINPMPLYGAHHCSYNVLWALEELGYEIHLFNVHNERNPYIGSLQFDVKSMEQHQRTDSIKDLKKSFRNFVEKVQPILIIVDDLDGDKIVDHILFKSITKVMYNHHSRSPRNLINKSIAEFWNHNPPKSLSEVSEEFVDIDFYKDKNICFDKEEFSIYDRYSSTLAMGDGGYEIIKKNVFKTKLYKTFCALKKQKFENLYKDHALLLLGPTPVNVQGFYFFAKKVMPLIQKEAPFLRIRFFSAMSEYIYNVSGIINRGFAMDLKDEYKNARMLLCPTFAGTGQQVKIIEAMSYSLPVVAMHNPWQGCAILHHETGFIAYNAEEFAEYTLRLYKDLDLARKMGKRAKEHFVANYSFEKLVASFRKIPDLVSP